MALADERGAQAPHDGPDGANFDRQPPQDLAAEQSVLGGMMLSKDAIADVVEVLSPSDFYRPAHQTIYNVVLDLYGRGEPADAITVSADLERRQELLKVGGAPYMHTLIATVPTAANAGYYAEIVAEKAVLRRLVEAGTRIVQLGYHGSEGQAIEEVVDRAQAAVHDVTERRANEDYAALEDMLQPTMDEIDAIASRGGQSQGVPTGFADLDDLTNGLHAGQMIIVAARPGVGKALALDTELPTPHGWTAMGSVAPGDQLLGSDGRPTEVVAATDVLHDRPCFEVELSDGAVLVADAQHQWRLADGSVVTTEQLEGGRIAGHGVLDLPERELPVPPYLLGLWIAAGDARSGRLQLSGAPQRAAEARGVESDVDEDTAGRLAELGAWDDHDLPASYLRAGEQQRRALLAGLLDASGSVTDDGSVRLAISQPASVRVRELVLGLGYGCAALPPSEDVSERFDTTVLQFRSGDDEVFGCSERNEQHKRLRRPAEPVSWRVVQVRPVASVPVRCVEVAAADRMYLAGRSMVPTHNSTLGLDFARATSIKHGGASVIFSLEMGKTEIVMRMLSAEARIRLGDMRGGKMTDEDWTRLARRMSEISEAPLFVDDSPNLTMMEIRAKARRLKQRHDIQLIVVDYMQLMTSGKKVESRQQEVSEFSRSLKLLAKELEVPVVAISQLNRGPEQRNDKKPQLADLRESGCLTRDTTLLRADTGAPVSFGALLDEGYEGVLVWSLDEQRRLVPAPITNVFPSGVKPTFTMTLASGRRVTATGNHQFRTAEGWTPLDELEVGGRIAVPRHVPAPIADGLGWSEHRLGLLAHVIGSGCAADGTVRCTSADEANSAFVERAAANEFGLTPRRERGSSGQQVHLSSPWRCARGLRNPLNAWLDELGVGHGCEQRIPDALHGAADDEIRTFLHHLWAADGSAQAPGEAAPGGEPQVRYATGSRELADGVALLLSRLAISTRIERVDHPGSQRPDWHVAVAGEDAVRRFCAQIGVSGRQLPEVEPEAPDADVLREAAGDDVLWDRIVSIEASGTQPVFDATVKGTHNFVADGIVAHNSLEQDADMVILIHRPDAFERDDPRMGEADLILAKHRSGPVTTVTVAHQLHYSRFVDMAQE